VRATAKRIRTAVDLQKEPGAQEFEIPIIPILIGENEKTLDLAGRAMEAGFFIPAIRPPTVPRGTSRLRVSVSATHTDAQIESLIAFLTSEMHR
jgi:7-keto-8-aminopelargonate synthetase-like enzyme